MDNHFPVGSIQWPVEDFTDSGDGFVQCHGAVGDQGWCGQEEHRAVHGTIHYTID